MRQRVWPGKSTGHFAVAAAGPAVRGFRYDFFLARGHLRRWAGREPGRAGSRQYSPPCGRGCGGTPVARSREDANRSKETRRDAGGHFENDDDVAVARSGTNRALVAPDHVPRQTLRDINVVGAPRLGRNGKPQLVSVPHQPGNRRGFDGDWKSGRAARPGARAPVIRRAPIAGQIVQFKGRSAAIRQARATGRRLNR